MSAVQVLSLPFMQVGIGLLSVSLCVLHCKQGCLLHRAAAAALKQPHQGHADCLALGCSKRGLERLGQVLAALP